MSSTVWEQKEGRVKRWAVSHLVLQAAVFPGLGTGVAFLSVILSWLHYIYIPPPHTQKTYCTHSAVLYLTTFSSHLFCFLGSYVSFLQVHGFCSVITLVTMIFCNTLNLPFSSVSCCIFMLNSYYFYFHFPFSLPPFLSRLMIIFLLG